ncbi:hypothetical protein PFISCL1PPCAC_21043, partial [Pristionchus fissidentatus]
LTMSGAPSDSPYDPAKLQRFRRMFSEYTKAPGAPVTPRQAKSGSKGRTPKKVTPEKAPAPTPEAQPNEKIADAKEFAKADEEEFENENGAVMAQAKIKNRDLQWKKEAKSPQPRVIKTGEKQSGKKDSDSRGKANKSVDEGVRKKKSRSVNRRTRGTGGDKSAGRSSRSTMGGEKKTSGKRASGGRKKPTGRRTEETRTVSSPIISSPVKTDVADSPAEATSDGMSGGSAPEPFNREALSREAIDGVGEEGGLSGEVAAIDMNHADFKTAIKLMEIFKRNNILENALFPAQNETLKAFFEGGMKNPDSKILELISKAMDFVLDAVFFKGEDMDCLIDNELKSFIVNRSKSKPMLLDVIISRPEFLPLSWGGRTIVLRHTDATVLVQLTEAKRDKGANK